MAIIISPVLRTESKKEKEFLKNREDQRSGKVSKDEATAKRRKLLNLKGKKGDK